MKKSYQQHIDRIFLSIMNDFHVDCAYYVYNIFSKCSRLFKK